MANKLYVWNNPFNVKYGSSILYAVADSEYSAKKCIVTARVQAFGEYDDGHAIEKIVIENLGPPTRVLDLPCAECVYWSE